MFHNSVVSQRVDDTRLLTVISKDSSVDLQRVSQQCHNSPNSASAMSLLALGLVISIM